MTLPPDSRAAVRAARPDLRSLGLASLGPCLSLLALSTLFVLGARDCGSFRPWLAWSFLGVCVLASGGGMWALARPPSGHEASRARFLRVGGMALNALSLLLLGGFTLPLLLSRPCE